MWILRSAGFLIVIFAAVDLAGSVFVLQPVQRARPGVQAAVDQAMSGRAGAVVVLDVETGGLAGSYRIEAAARRLVPPGSVIKPFTLQALIEKGVVTANTDLI